MSKNTDRLAAERQDAADLADSHCLNAALLVLPLAAEQLQAAAAAALRAFAVRSSAGRLVAMRAPGSLPFAHRVRNLAFTGWAATARSNRTAPPPFTG